MVGDRLGPWTPQKTYLTLLPEGTPTIPSSTLSSAPSTSIFTAVNGGISPSSVSASTYIVFTTNAPLANVFGEATPQALPATGQTGEDNFVR